MSNSSDTSRKRLLCGFALPLILVFSSCSLSPETPPSSSPTTTIPTPVPTTEPTPSTEPEPVPEPDSSTPPSQPVVKTPPQSPPPSSRPKPSPTPTPTPAVTFTVHYLAGSGGSLIGVTTQLVTENSDGTSVEVIPDVGYRFVQWSDGSTMNPRTDTGVSGNLTVTAEFELLNIILNAGASHPVPFSATPNSITLENDSPSAANYLIVSSNLSDQERTATIHTGTGADAVTLPGGGVSTSSNSLAQSRRISDLAEYAAHKSTLDTSPPLTPAAGMPHGLVPSLGDVIHLNANPTATCSTGISKPGIVRYVGDHVIIAIDQANPFGAGSADGGLNNSLGQNLNTLGDEFDASIYPAVTGAYGSPTDHDGNGRVVIFITEEMNRLDAPATNPSEFARSSATDLLDQDECAKSNFGEVIYFMAPDPDGVVNGNVRTVSSLLNGFGHSTAIGLSTLIIDAQRLENNLPAYDFWIEEAIRNLSAELVFYARSVGLAPEQNIQLVDLTTGIHASQRVSAFNSYANTNFSLFRPYLQQTRTNGVLDNGVRNLASNGAAWSLLRYVLDRYPDSATDFFAELWSQTSADFTAIEAVIGESLSEWIHDWMVSLYLDDAPGSGTLGSSGNYAQPSWNFRSVYGGLGGYPLPGPPIFADDSTATFTLAKLGSTSYLSVTLDAHTTRDFEFIADGAGDARFTIIRIP